MSGAVPFELGGKIPLLVHSLLGIKSAVGRILIEFPNHNARSL
jgi:hypothetical protein